MKIALVTDKFPPDIGGLANSIERFARMLLIAGYEPHVITPSTDLTPGFGKRESYRGIDVHRFGEFRRIDDTLASWFDLVISENRRVGFDLLHSYFITRAGFVAVYAGDYLAIPTIISARGNDLDRAVFDPGKAVQTLFALQNASAITANTRELVRKAQALAPGRTVTYIPNGVDGEVFYPRQRDSLLVSQLGLEGKPVIGFVGEARAKKGLSTALLAFRDMAVQHPASFLLVGGVRSGEDQDLVRVFQKQNPQLQVVIQPYVHLESMPEYYSLMDVLIMPSLHDGLPNALLEGMACERAVVATPVGGIPDALQNGENGRFVPPGDSRALSEAILELLADPELCRLYGNKARVTVLKDFSITQELEGNLAVYRQLMG